MIFQIQIMSAGVPSGFLCDTAGGRILQFENPREANLVATARNNSARAGNMTVRYKLARVENKAAEKSQESGAAPVAPPFADWRRRELRRFAFGAYTPTPWAGAQWYLDSPLSRLHYCHISTQNPGKVAYTESLGKGADDRQTRIRAGRYLQKYFADVLESNHVAYWAAKVSLATGESELSFATTPDEIADTYANGPRSCMGSHPDSKYHCNRQPTYVYGAGDLAVAYINRGGDICSRVLCWPDKLRYGRVYGDDGAFDSELVESLQNLGYRENYDTDGARLLRIRYGEGFIVPYLDSGMGVSEHCDKYLVIDSCGDYSADSEYGTTHEEERQYCESCENSFSMDSNFYYLESAGVSWCEDCFHEYGYRCEDCESCFTNNDAGYYENIEKSLCDSCIDNYPGCDNCAAHYDDSDSLTPVNDGDESLCAECFEKCGAFTCDSCNEPFTTAENETQESADMFKDSESLCDSCFDEYKKEIHAAMVARMFLTNGARLMWRRTIR